MVENCIYQERNTRNSVKRMDGISGRRRIFKSLIILFSPARFMPFNRDGERWPGRMETGFSR